MLNLWVSQLLLDMSRISFPLQKKTPQNNSFHRTSFSSPAVQHSPSYLYFNLYSFLSEHRIGRHINQGELSDSRTPQFHSLSNVFVRCQDTSCWQGTPSQMDTTVSLDVCVCVGGLNPRLLPAKGRREIRVRLDCRLAPLFLDIGYFVPYFILNWPLVPKDAETQGRMERDTKKNTSL